MSELPQRLGHGVNLTAHWLNRLLDWCRSRELRAGRGIRLTRTPTGTTVSVAHAAAGPDKPDAFLARIVSCSAGVYKAAKANEPAIDVTRYFDIVTPEVHTRGTVNMPATVIAHRVSCRIEQVIAR